MHLSKNIRAFETLFRTYYEPLCRYAHRLIENLDAAEEIVQDLFYVLWKDREKLQIFTSINGYLYRAVKNKSLLYLEHEKVRENYRKAYAEHAAALPDSTPQEELEYKELEQKIQETLSRLPERRQKIFRMHRLDGKKYGEIARELRISVKTVEAEMSKTLQELRDKYRSIYHTKEKKKEIQLYETN